jgi:hypothetical protein
MYDSFDKLLFFPKYANEIINALISLNLNSFGTGSNLKSSYTVAKSGGKQTMKQLNECQLMA